VILNLVLQNLFGMRQFNYAQGNVIQNKSCLERSDKMSITICPNCRANCSTIDIYQCEECGKTLCENCRHTLQNLCENCDSSILY